MNNSQSKAAAARRLNPRKAPSQPRSAQTIAAILEGAAHILEQSGFAGYTTNAIAARAGVSIGSLYQYFPTKDAVTVALIAREQTALVRDATGALALPDWHAALHRLIAVAVAHQLRRPVLGRLLDFEQQRLSSMLPASGNGAAMHAALVAFLHRRSGTAPAEGSASDLMALISSLTDAAGHRGNVEPAPLVARIEAAVLGYLSVQ
jgi:AcrR family transcriptional regulator